ncbi:MAG TPA: PIN domain-containing protein [Thermomicrobiales bacterium]|jgi:predicted nucleic acid-binding protein
MMRAVVADTGPLYAAVDPDDLCHRRSRADLARLAGEEYGVVVVGSTLLECYTLIVQRLGPTVANRWLGEIEAGATVVQPTLDDLTAAATLARRSRDPLLTMFDAVLAVVGRRLDLPVWTFDHRFAALHAPIWR